MGSKTKNMKKRGRIKDINHTYPFNKTQQKLIYATELHNSGKLNQAGKIYREILATDPNNPDALNLSGLISLNSHFFDKAEGYFKKAIENNPHNPNFHINLGRALQGQAKYEKALSCYQKAIRLFPENHDIYFHLGNLQRALQNNKEAIAGYLKVLEYTPDHAPTLNNLGNAYRDLGEFNKAISNYKHGLKADPTMVEILNNMGNAYKSMGDFEKSVSCYQKAVSIRPEYPDPYNNIGYTLQRMGRLSEAVSYFKKALRIQPDLSAAHHNLANTYKEMGEFENADIHYRKAVKIDPHFAEAHSNILFSMNYNPLSSPSAMYNEAKLWWQHQASHLANRFVHRNSNDSLKRIKLGYVSPDFRTHSVSFFFLSLLQAHDHEKFEIFCYADIMTPDETTLILRHLSDHWRPIFNLSDETVAKKIHDDQIDILIDLAGHTANNRLLVFAAKPSPVQVTWLGYPNTTGLQNMDYRITDVIADPPGHDQFYSEKLVRLPNGFLCYTPPSESPDVADLPAHRLKHITFGSFNNLTKTTDQVIKIWAKILQSVHESRLIMKSNMFSDPACRKRILSLFEKFGIPRKRIQLLNRTSSMTDHLDLYSQIDIALDPFPYNGTTTTFEALWMGVPVVTLCGATHAGRVGATILTHTGLKNFIADSEEEYINTAVNLSRDTRRLREIRQSLRQTLTDSPLMNPKMFAHEFEKALKEMWLSWSNSTSKSQDNQTAATLEQLNTHHTDRITPGPEHPVQKNSLSVYELNLSQLRQYHPDLYQQILSRQPRETGAIFPHTKESKLNNLRFLMPNNAELLAYNDSPQIDAQKSLANIESDSEALLVIVGLGLGYVALHAVHTLSDMLRIAIIEPSPDMFITAMKSTDLTPLFKNQKVHFFVGPLPVNDFKNTCETDATAKDIHILHHKPSFQWQPDLYEKTFDTVFSILNKFQVAGGTSAKTAAAFFENRFQALTLIHHTTPLDALSKIFRDKPAVLVAAGPSLNQDIHLLKKAKGKCVIICADSALSVLLQEGITPDFVTSADYSMLSFEKTAPYIGLDMPFSLLVLPKVCPLVLKRLKPRRTFIGLNKDAGQNWLIDIFNIKHPLPPISSVAHLSLGLAIIAEADPIILLGQDLAFTDMTSDHVKGAIIHGQGTSSPRKDDLVKPGVRGATVITDRAFLEMKDQFEEIIKKNHQLFINATSKGLRIDGTTEMPFSEVQATMLNSAIPVEDIVQQAAGSYKKYQADRLTDKGQKIIKDIARVKQLIKQFLETNRQLKREITKLSKNRKTYLSQSELPKSTFKNLKKIHKLNKTINSYRGIWDLVAEPTFSMQTEIDAWQERNRTLFQKEGYLPWLREEMKRFEFGQKTREKAILLLKNNMGNLLDHMQKETLFINQLDKKAGVLGLAKTYIASGDFILAQNVLKNYNTIPRNNPKQAEEEQILEGAVYAGLFPEKENKIWQAIAANPQEESSLETINGLSLSIATPWLNSIKKYGDNLYLLKKCIKRLSLLIPFADKKLKNEILLLWKSHTKEISTLIEKNNYTETEIQLSIWYTVEKYLPPDYWYFKAKAAFFKGQNQPALTFMQKAIQPEENDAGKLAFFAELLLETGHFSQGLDYLKKAVNIDPEKAVLWEEIGDLLTAQNDFSGAIMAYEKCMEALPDRPATLKKLAEAHLHTGNLETARSILQDAYKQTQNSPLTRA